LHCLGSSKKYVLCALAGLARRLNISDRRVEKIGPGESSEIHSSVNASGTAGRDSNRGWGGSLLAGFLLGLGLSCDEAEDLVDVVVLVVGQDTVDHVLLLQTDLLPEMKQYTSPRIFFSIDVLNHPFL